MRNKVSPVASGELDEEQALEARSIFTKEIIDETVAAVSKRSRCPTEIVGNLSVVGFALVCLSLAQQSEEDQEEQLEAIEGSIRAALGSFEDETVPESVLLVTPAVANIH